MADTRIAYGANCVWWDSIANVGVKAPGRGWLHASVLVGGLPCCPHCGGMLFEVVDEATWWAGARNYEAQGHPGYVAMLQWSRGRCLPNLDALVAAYAEARP